MLPFIFVIFQHLSYSFPFALNYAKLLLFSFVNFYVVALKIEKISKSCLRLQLHETRRARDFRVSCLGLENLVISNFKPASKLLSNETNPTVPSVVATINLLLDNPW